jgi:hypothetical protein
VAAFSRSEPVGWDRLSTSVHFLRAQFSESVLLEQMAAQFEAEMAFADVTGGIGLELWSMPFPCLDYSVLT